MIARIGRSARLEFEQPAWPSTLPVRITEGSMEHPYLPPSLRYFVPPRIMNGTLGVHACFEYDLIEATKPGLVVDLGAGNAQSFATFCQSMKDHDIDGLAYAIDSWECDEQREADEQPTLSSINNFIHAHFRFGYLLPLTPDQALAHFADGSIDLLRIDVHRVERPLDELLEAWVPKLEPGGFLLSEGLMDHPRALAAFRGHAKTGFVFPTGLGVYRRGSPHGEPPAHELLGMLSEGDEETRQGLVRYYRHAAFHHALRITVDQHADVLNRKPAGRPG